MNLKKEILFLLYLVLLPAAVRSQQPVSVDTLVARIDKQREAYPQEKIHVTTDRDTAYNVYLIKI